MIVNNQFSPATYGKYESRNSRTYKDYREQGGGIPVVLSRTRATQDTLHDITRQDTQPNPVVVVQKPTLAELRQRCGVSHVEVARASGVRLCRVVWMEHGIKSSCMEVLMVLFVYSRKLARCYTIEDIRGMNVQRT